MLVQHNSGRWPFIAAAVCWACTTAQQSAPGATSTSLNAGGSAGNPEASMSAAEAKTASVPTLDNGVSAVGVRLGPQAGSVGVSEVANQAVGSTITVSGVFMGFNGACLSDAPSRSAWHLSASKDPKAPCIYVDGPFPEGLSPVVHAGTPATVTGTVTALGNTKYLLGTGK